jgi:hypothetical protein
MTRGFVLFAVLSRRPGIVPRCASGWQQSWLSPQRAHRDSRILIDGRKTVVFCD